MGAVYILFILLCSSAHWVRPAGPLKMNAWFLIRASQLPIERKGLLPKRDGAVSLTIFFISHVASKHFAKEQEYYNCQIT